MSPEAGLAVVLTLLVGPTAIWLAYLAIRGNQGRYGESFLAGSASSGSAQTTTNQTEELIAEGFWVCGKCRSMNRREVKLCYACRTAPASDEGQAADELPARGVPVMAEGIARPPDKVPVAAVARKLAVELPARGVPVMAEGIARPPDKVPVAAVAHPRRRRTDAAAAADAAVTAVVEVEAPVREPEHAPSTAPRQASANASANASASASVCPFLGLVDDRATWCGFPDPRNVCHATPVRDGTSEWSAAKLLIDRFAGARSQPIAAEHQGSMCLTAAHEQCARYPAGDAASAVR